MLSAHNIRNFAPSKELEAHFEGLGLNSDSKNMVRMNMNLGNCIWDQFLTLDASLLGGAHELLTCIFFIDAV